ncbi:guanylate kinase [Ichthyobacterium seriolicida]|uniref:Guanylate kinase n=1 Tax=Ichthyobacterium seriolicida TaxID=242600 RepID=A0A1J1DZ68_9FLAO|nr:guanylate kinase [Ichthyobacterium seriolicida]BAV95185.1 Guanylate kinase [Ichthyobacterium seriolicida]
MSCSKSGGKLLIFSAPSGSGKTTLVKYLLEINKSLSFSISACSRAKRQGEVDGKNYYFLSVEEFKKNIEENKFIEWEEVYPNNFYGTLKSEIERIWSLGKHVVLDVDVVGGLNIKKMYSRQALAVFVKVSSLEELKKRLKKRATETDEKLQIRIEKIIKELEYSKYFDAIVLNDDLITAKKQAVKLVDDFLKL